MKSSFSGPAAVFPAVHATTKTSDYVVGVKQAYVAEHKLLGWSWRVGPRYGNGAWGPSSRGAAST